MIIIVGASATGKSVVVKKMKEMFNRIKDIIIPFAIIPEGLLSFINSYNDIVKQFDNKKGILYLNSGGYFDIFE